MMPKPAERSFKPEFRPKFLRAIGAYAVLVLRSSSSSDSNLTSPLVHYEAHYNTDRKGAAAESKREDFVVVGSVISAEELVEIENVAASAPSRRLRPVWREV